MRVLALFMIVSFAMPALAGGKSLPKGALADYQLGGGYPPAHGVTIVVRDSQDQPAPGYFNICYVNGFQTQPGVSWDSELLVAGPDGKPLKDPNWPDEFLLDISTPKKRAANLERILPYLRACAIKGFNAVEFDNLDSYSRVSGAFTIEDTLAFARLLVTSAERLRLPSGQKNTAALGPRGRKEAGFAFAVAEGCYRWGECAAYTDVYGADQVLGIEYADDLRGRFSDACADPARPASLILRDRLLRKPAQEGYVFDACAPRS